MTTQEALEIDTTALIDGLERKADTIATAVAYIQAVRGAAHFRECVKDLLAGTPYDEPSGYDVEGLYGRLRNAIMDAVKYRAALPVTPTQEPK